MPRAKRRSEFIPLGYNTEGEVVDIREHVRDVEAIPYALDNVYIGIAISCSALELSREILGFFRKNIPGEFKGEFEKTLKGKVGFIAGPSDTIEDPEGRGMWAPVQLYRVKD